MPTLPLKRRSKSQIARAEVDRLQVITKQRRCGGREMPIDNDVYNREGEGWWEEDNPLNILHGSITQAVSHTSARS
jgi:hypothetical protein